MQDVQIVWKRDTAHLYYKELFFKSGIREIYPSP